MTINQTEVAWLIRDARGIPANVKLLLHTVNSRGDAGCSTAWKTTAADMGRGKDAFYSARKWATEREVIKAVPRRDDTTLYFVNVEALRRFLPDAHSGNPDGAAILETRNGRVNLSTCSLSTPSMFAPNPSTWTTPDEGIEVCVDHGGGTTKKEECQHCHNAASRRRAEAKHSDAQKRQWFEKNQHESEDPRALA